MPTSSNSRLIAIDPGAVSGAFAFFSGNELPYVEDLPGANGQVDAVAFSRFIKIAKPDVAVVERVSSMPKQGVASTFKFGMSVGLVHGVLLSHGVSLELVTPSVWKGALGLLNQDKDAARAMAIRLYPSVTGLDRKKDQGRADALLMGLWYRSGHNKRRVQE